MKRLAFAFLSVPPGSHSVLSSLWSWMCLSEGVLPFLVNEVGLFHYRLMLRKHQCLSSAGRCLQEVLQEDVYKLEASLCYLPQRGEKGSSLALTLPEISSKALPGVGFCLSVLYSKLLLLDSVTCAPPQHTHHLSTQTEETSLFRTGQKPALSRSNSAD